MRLFDPRDLHVGGSGNSNPDAVRPSGETGARCRIYELDGAYHCYEHHVTWHDPKADCPKAAAARPLPDFPAGKSEDEGWISNAISKIPKRYILCPTCGEKNRIIVCVNLCGLPTAPARPADAVVGERDPENYIHPLGYTVPAAAGLTDNEIRDCIYVGARAAGWQAEPVPSEVEFATAAIRHAALLSSRATGAEVEIPELTNDEIVALCKEAWGVSMPVSIHDISTSTVRLVRLAYARRYATMRTSR